MTAFLTPATRLMSRLTITRKLVLLSVHAAKAAPAIRHARRERDFMDMVGTPGKGPPERGRARVRATRPTGRQGRSDDGSAAARPAGTRGTSSSAVD